MLVLLHQLLRLAALIFLTGVGLAVAFVFIGSTVVVITALVIAARLSGKSFSAKEYWVARNARRKPIFKDGPFSTKNSTDVTDVKARDVP